MNKVELAIFIVIIIFIFTYFKPSLLFLNTTITGGDTASHFYPALYLKEYLLPKGKLFGWNQGNYAGFPMFQFYFPFPFLIAVLLSYVMPLKISFKIVTVLGIFLLPFASYFLFYSLKYKFPIPIIASISILLFLFHEEYSMWGGNILSTLAGEFSYSIGLALTLIFIGFLVKGLPNRYVRLNSILLFLIGLTHAYTLLVAILLGTFFLFSKEFKIRLNYLLRIYFYAFLLLSFWLLPLIAKLRYTIPYNFKWYGIKFFEIFPRILIPFLVISLLTPVAYLKSEKVGKRNILLFLYGIACSIILFYSVNILKVVDIRFIPFFQLFLVFLSNSCLAYLLESIKAKSLVPFIFLFIVMGAVTQYTYHAPHWIKWNYEGFENKARWSLFSDINNFLKGSLNDGRVVYEHSQKHNWFGTIRAFESLPLFSGRATLEGVYMQSSLSAPFVFYIQSEIGNEKSCPYPNYPCTGFNLTKALKHLKMFNVRHAILFCKDVPKEFKVVYKKEGYCIYELNNTGYVEVLDYKPVIIKTKNPSLVAYLWFIKGLEVPIVFDKTGINVMNIINNSLPMIKINNNCKIKEFIAQERIRFITNCTRLPHIIKVSYFPNWKVKGAKKVYYVTPSFMLVYPIQKEVTLYYGKTFSDWIGLILTFLGFILLFSKRFRNFNDILVNKVVDYLIRYKPILAIFLIIFLITMRAEPEKDLLYKEIAIASREHYKCKYAGRFEIDCFIEIAKLTNNYNLCLEKIKSKRDECLYEVAITSKNSKICNYISSAKLRSKCGFLTKGLNKNFT